ncbi:peptide methionine sulfoxide reductase MsrA [Mycena vulgaris]|nr:peptide methionine sulfoxide reductase MsrA [Mycena vulgaris]
MSASVFSLLNYPNWFHKAINLSRAVAHEDTAAHVDRVRRANVKPTTCGHIFVKHFPPAKGILKTTVGYTGGLADSTNSDYRSVCSGATEHAEALRIEFDESIMSYAELVEFFHRSHDPTTVNRQGGDNTALRSLPRRPSRLLPPVASRRKCRRSTPKGTKIVSEIHEAGPWWDAETYHQLYLFKNPTGYQCPTHRLHW